MNILITAGPTREHWDAVRFISNASSGRMGFALAESARAAGHVPTLVLGPVDLPPPVGIPVVRVTSADEMRDAVLAALPKTDVLIAAAAVADWKPVERLTGKPRRGAPEMTLRLVPTVDVLGEARKAAAGKVRLVGFALEAGDLATGAARKLREKGLDLVVADGPSAIGAESTTAEIHGPKGLIERLVDKSKREIADAVLRHVAALRAAT